jgi:ectoine hydroxylase-related dioxygenase (phytanoyl-CoA dioxygenase family)
MSSSSAEINEFFQENGYYLARGVFSPDETKMLEEDFDRVVAQLQGGGENVNARWNGDEMKRLDGGNSVIIHTHNILCYSARWLAALMHPAFLEVATAILGPDVILHHTKLFQKPAEKGSPFPMHQDWTYFPSVKDTMMAGIVHVSEATNEMGCLRIYPGSHRLGRVEGTSGNIANEILQKYPLEGATILEAEPGDVVFFHYFTLHGSMPNRSDKVRKTVLVQLHAGDDEIEERGLAHTNERLVLAGWNHRMARGLANTV